MFRRTDEGAVIDPPILPEYERDLYRAMERADQDEIDRLNDEYTTARTKRADDLDAREKRRAEDSAAADAAARDVVRERERIGEQGRENVPFVPFTQGAGGVN